MFRGQRPSGGAVSGYTLANTEFKVEEVEQSATADLGVAEMFKQVLEEQQKISRRLMQVLRENVNFQNQVRGGMQDELDIFREQQRGEQFTPILKAIAAVCVEYRSLLDDENIITQIDETQNFIKVGFNKGGDFNAATKKNIVKSEGVFQELIKRVDEIFQTTCEKILQEFGLNPKRGHIINGHVPVKVSAGESPVKANGKAIVIDGGFCEAYHNKTGISGFTLVYNSRGLRLLEHQKIADVKTALQDNGDIESVSETIDLQAYRTTIGDTDLGKKIREEIADLNNLLTAYQSGLIQNSNLITD